MNRPDRHHLSRRSLIAIALLAAALRLGWALAVPVVPVSDSHAYDTFARNIAAGVGMAWEPGRPTAYWPVGTPALYAAIYAVLGASYVPIVVLNIALGVAIAVFTAILGARWFGSFAGRAAGIVLACWPSHIQFTTILASELPFTFLIVAGTWTWITMHEAAVRGHPHRRLLARAAVCGVIFALASLVRPTALLIPAVLAGLEFLTLRHRLRTLASAAACFIVMGLCIAPWAYRNTTLFGELVLISTNGGVNLWMGNNPRTTGQYQPELPAAPGMNEAAWNQMHKDQAVAFIREDPAAFVRRSAIKAVRLHDRETIGVAWNKGGLTAAFPSRFADQPESEAGPARTHEQRGATRALKLGSSVYWYGVLGLAVLGVPVMLRRGPLWLAINHPATVMWAYFIAVHAVLVYQDRYHFPATPFMATIAGLTLSWGIGRVRREPAPAREPAP